MASVKEGRYSGRQTIIAILSLIVFTYQKKKKKAKNPIMNSIIAFRVEVKRSSITFSSVDINFIINVVWMSVLS